MAGLWLSGDRQVLLNGEASDRYVKGCNELIREICALVDHGETMTSSTFHDLCEQGRLVDYLKGKYGAAFRIDYLDKNSRLFSPAAFQAVNDALGRWSNAQVMSDYALEHNALLLAVNQIAVALSEDDGRLIRNG